MDTSPLGNGVRLCYMRWRTRRQAIERPPQDCVGPQMRMLTHIFLALVCCGSAAAPAGALGTARIQQADGTVKNYSNVYIRIANKSMSVTSADRKGTIILQDAACSIINGLMRCYPYAGTLKQNGKSRAFSLEYGTVWLNASDTTHKLPKSSTQLPPRGVMLSLKTKKGTYVSLTGTIDEMKK
jgi:hypothetical protein